VGEPLIFRPGAASTLFNDEYEHFAAGRKRLVPGVW